MRPKEDISNRSAYDRNAATTDIWKKQGAYPLNTTSCACVSLRCERVVKTRARQLRAAPIIAEDESGITYLDKRLEGKIADAEPALQLHGEAHRGLLARVRRARAGLDRYFRFYNAERRHQALGRRTPDEVYFGG